MGGVASEGLPAQGREGFLHHRHQAGALGAPQVQGWECQLARGIHPGVLQRVGDLQARALLHNARAAYHASVHVLLHGKVGGGAAALRRSLQCLRCPVPFWLAQLVLATQEAESRDPAV